LHSSHPDIEEIDFLQMPVEDETNGTFDVIVCSMVLNCVTTPADRGKMLSLLYKQLSPGGLCFLTIPKLCIYQSKYMTREVFEEILTDALGFIIENKKETPKVAFWILKRPCKDVEARRKNEWNTKWETTSVIVMGKQRQKKSRNCFAISLKKHLIPS